MITDSERRHFNGPCSGSNHNMRKGLFPDIDTRYLRVDISDLRQLDDYVHRIGRTGRAGRKAGPVGKQCTALTERTAVTAISGISVVPGAVTVCHSPQTRHKPSTGGRDSNKINTQMLGGLKHLEAS